MKEKISKKTERYSTCMLCTCSLGNNNKILILNETTAPGFLFKCIDGL